MHITPDMYVSSTSSGSDCDAASTASDLVCHEFSQPQVALCLGGAARTFVQPLVWRSIQTNLMQAFGGAVTVLAAIKASDDRGDRRPSHGGLVSTTVAQIRMTLRRLGAADENTIVAEAQTLPGSLTIPACQSGRQRATPLTQRQLDLLDSLAGQLNARRACSLLLRSAEQRRGWRFDYVIFARPDLMWAFAIRPFCLWDLSVSVRKGDWAVMGPRAHADEWLTRNAAEFFEWCALA